MGEALHRGLSRLSERAGRLWRWLSGLSLDVSLGALGLAALIAEGLGRELLYPELSALWGSVSLIYCLDHALDLRRAAQAQSPRRRLHHEQRAQLWGLSLLSLLCALCSLPALQALSLKLGLSLASLCGLYLALTQRAGLLSSLSKKGVVALLYPMGLLLPSLASAELDNAALPTLSLSLLSLSALCLTLANLCLFELGERLRAQRSARAVETLRGLSLSLSLAPGALALGGRWALSAEEALACKPLSVIALMGLCHLLITLRLERLSADESYRRYADSAFLLSWLSLCLT